MAISTDVSTDADVAYLDYLVTYISWSRSVIALIMIICYDVTTTYISFTFTAKESWKIMLSPSAGQPAVGGRHCRVSLVIWYTRLRALMLGTTFTRSNYSDLTTFQLDSASLVHRTPYGIVPHSFHNMTATNTEKVAAVSQHQNVQHWSVISPAPCAAWLLFRWSLQPLPFVWLI